MSSATPRDTLPVSTTSSMAAGSASVIACAIERNSPVRAVAVTRSTLNAWGLWAAPAFRPEELAVAVAPLSLPETDDNDSDPKTNQDDPRNEKRPSARQENREQSRADE